MKNNGIQLDFPERWSILIRHVETETLIRLFGFGGSQDPHDRGVFFHAQGFPADVPPRFQYPGMAQRREASLPAAKKRTRVQPISGLADRGFCQTITPQPRTGRHLNSLDCGGFSHPGKSQLGRFSAVTFSGSHAQIFLHWPLGPYAENPSDRILKDTLPAVAVPRFSPEIERFFPLAPLT